ncbi:MAG: Ig-like domain-containing protein [bacterium]|nr:Ig-like domain-containing protein [bacterium]
MLRKTFNLFILSSLFILSPIIASGYQWPVDSFDKQHPINATLGEYRSKFHNGVDIGRFHRGVDIGEPEKTNVYPVVSGTVAKIVYRGKNSYVTVEDGNRKIDYVHINPNPSIRVNQSVTAGETVLGTINDLNHLHFQEDEGAVNPLRPGGLTPFTDKGEPKVKKVEVVKDSTPDAPDAGKPFPTDSNGIPIVSGNVDIKVWAYDPRVNADGTPGERGGMGIYRIGYEVRKESDGTLVEGPTYRIQFDTISSDYKVKYVYDPKSSYIPVNFIYLATNYPNSNGYWNTERLEDGRYKVKSLVEDIKGRSAEKGITVIIDLTPPKVKESTTGNNAQDVPLDSTIEITLEDPKKNDYSSGIDPKSLKPEECKIDPKIDGTWKIKGEGFIFIPNERLKEETTYKVTIPKEAAKDKAGNELESHIFTFKSGWFGAKALTTSYQKVYPRETVTHVIAISNHLGKNEDFELVVKNPSGMGWSWGFGSPGGGERIEVNAPYDPSNDKYKDDDATVCFMAKAPRVPCTSVFTAQIFIQIKDKPETEREVVYLGDITQGERINDHPDDNYEISDPQYPTNMYISSKADVAMLLRGYSDGMGHLLGRWKIPVSLILDDLTPIFREKRTLSDYPVLIIPTLGLSGISNSPTTKAKLEEYVKNGGTIICFTQQHGYDFEALPRGDELKGYGWSEDQSCWRGSVSISTPHPVFAGQDTQILDIVTDGYFDRWPDDSTILLRRTKNDMPAMLMYPYGKGIVIVSGFYEDWAYGNSQSTKDGRNLVRDLVTFAKDPDKHIPEYRGEEKINEQLTIRNDQLTIAERIKVRVYDPDKNELVSYNQELTTPLEAGESITIPFDYTAPQSLGIYEVTYILLDRDDEEIQEEEVGLRFGVSLGLVGVAKKDLSINITSDGDEVRVKGTPATFTITVRNNSDEIRKVTLNWHSHAGGGSIGTYTVLPKSSISIPYTTDRIYFYWQGPRWEFYIYCPEAGTRWIGLAGICVEPLVYVSLLTDKYEYQRGEDLELDVLVKNLMSNPQNVNLKINIVDLNWEDWKEERTLEVDLGSEESVREKLIFQVPEYLYGGIYKVKAEAYVDQVLLYEAMTTFKVTPLLLSLESKIKEAYAWGNDANLDFIIKNDGDIDREVTLSGFFSCYYQPFEKTLFIPAGGEVSYTHIIETVWCGSTLTASLYTEKGVKIEQIDKWFDVYKVVPRSTLSTNKKRYLRGEEVKITLDIQDSHKIDYPARVKVVMGNGLWVIGDEEVEIIDGKATKEFTYIIPKDAERGYYNIKAYVYYQEEMIGYGTTSFYVLKPKLAVKPSLPDVFTVKGSQLTVASGERVNPVDFEIENVGPIDVIDGKLEVSLECRVESLEEGEDGAGSRGQEEEGEEVWRDEREFGKLKAGYGEEQGEKTTLEFDIPIEEVRFGTYVLKYVLKYETEEIKGEEEIVSKVTIKEFKLDKTSYKVRDEMKIELEVINAGGFEERFKVGLTSASLKPIALEDQELILLPGESKILNYATTIIEDIEPGVHEVEVVISHQGSGSLGDGSSNQGSGSLGEDEIIKKFSFVVSASRLEAYLDKKYYSCGKGGSIKITNAGGVDTNYSYNLRLVDWNGLVFFEEAGSGSIKAGDGLLVMDGGKIGFMIPEQLVSGGYNLMLELKDEKKNEGIKRLFYINVNGLQARVTPKTEEKIYFYGDQVNASTLIEKLGLPINGASLKIRAYASGGEWTHYPDIRDVNAIVADGDYVLFGTAGYGVRRYNKKNDTWDLFDTSNSGLLDDNVLLIGVDTHYLWFVTSRGVSRCDKTMNNWENFTKEEIGLSFFDSIQSIAIDNDYVWFGGDYPGLIRYSKGNGEWMHWSLDEIGDKIGIEGLIINSMVVDDGILYMGTSEWCGSQDYLIKLETETETLSVIKEMSVLALSQDSDCLWIGWNNILTGYNKQTGEFKDYEIPYSPEYYWDGVSDGTISVASLCVDEYKVYLGSDKGGVYIFDKERKTWEELVSEIGSPQSVLAIAADEDYVWFAGRDTLTRFDRGYRFQGEKVSYGECISMIDAGDRLIILPYDTSRLIFYDKATGYTEEINIPLGTHSSESSMALDGDCVWIVGKHNDVILRYDMTNDHFDEWMLNWLVDDVFALDGDYVWFRLEGGKGIQAIRYDKINDDLRLYKDVPDYLDFKKRYYYDKELGDWVDSHLEINKVYPELSDLYKYIEKFIDEFEYLKNVAVCGDYVWFSGGSGLIRYDKAADSWRYFDLDIETGKIWANDGVIYIDCNGLYRYDPTTTELSKLLNLSSEVTFLLFDDKDLWLGTNGEGLWHYEGGSWTQFTEENTDGGLLSNRLFAGCLDGSYIWLDCGTITRYDKAAGEWKSYREDWFDSITSILADQVFLWIGGRGGLFKMKKVGEILFDETIQVNVGSDVTTNHLLGILDTLGKVYIDAVLTSSKGQLIDHGQNTFYIINTSTSLSFETDKPIYKPYETVTITGKIHNAAQIPTNPLKLKLRKKDKEVIYQEENIVLQPYETRQFTTTTTADKSFVLEGSIGDLKLTDFVEVAKPELEVTIDAQEVVSRDEFTPLIILKNTGKVELQIENCILKIAKAEDGEELTVYCLLSTVYCLRPGETKIFEQPLQIHEDVILSVEVSGDVRKTVAKQIGFGEKVTIGVTPEEIYPIGIIEVPFVITNGGSLDSKLEVVFVLEKTEKENGAGSREQEADGRGESVSGRSQKVERVIGGKMVYGPWLIVHGQKEGYNRERRMIREQLQGLCWIIPQIRISKQQEEGSRQREKEKEAQSVTTNQLTSTSYQLSSYKDSVELVKTFYIPAGEKIAGDLVFNLNEGDYKLLFTSELSSGATYFKVAKDGIVEINKLEVGSGKLEANKLPTDVMVKNLGGNNFVGVLRLDAGFYEEESQIELESAQEETYRFGIPLEASSGEYTARAEVLHDGWVIAEKEQRFKLEPWFEITGIWGKSGEAGGSGISFDVGEEGRFKFAVKNTGTAEGKVILHLKFLDLVDEEKEVWLGVGQTEEVEFSFEVPDDLEDKDHIAVLSSQWSVVSGIKEIEEEIQVHINGIKIGVEAELDKPFYQEGDTAVLTLKVTNLTSLSLAMYTKINFNDYQERQDFELGPMDGSQSTVELQFNIPIQFTGQKIGYGVYMSSGRSIYLNSMYVRKKGEIITLWTDKEVYGAGEEVIINYQLSMSNEELATGNYQLSIDGEEVVEPFTIPLTENEGTTSFILPKELNSGTYIINYELTEGSQQLEKGEYRFDVIGYEVIIIKATLDKQVYNSGDELNLDLTIKSNSDLDILVRAWIYNPEGGYEDFFNKGAILSCGRTRHRINGEITDTMPGVHLLVYAIYSGNNEWLLLAAGSESFDLNTPDTINTDFSATPDSGEVDDKFPRATIVRPNPGDRVSGDAVLIKVVSEDKDIVNINFQYRLSNQGAWTDIVSSIDTGSIYSVTWDTTWLTEGSYDLRAVAEDAMGNVDTDPPYITVIVDHPNADYSEYGVKMAKDNVIENGDGIRVKIPAGVLTKDTIIKISKPDPADIPPNKDKPTGLFLEITLESGQEHLNGYIFISMPYLDNDNNGLVDGTDILEENLKVNIYRDTGWKRLPTTIDAIDNIATGKTDHLGSFGLFGSLTSDLDNVLVFPNPFRPGKGETIRFLNLTENVIIRIYNVAGELIRYKEDITDHWKWDGRNDHGQPVATGGYIYIITDDNGRKKIGKIAVVW